MTIDDNWQTFDNFTPSAESLSINYQLLKQALEVPLCTPP